MGLYCVLMGRSVFVSIVHRLHLSDHGHVLIQAFVHFHFIQRLSKHFLVIIHVRCTFIYLLAIQANLPEQSPFSKGLLSVLVVPHFY